ncbi:MAG TPA: CAP domain-containing protein, partial [Candidatus Tectomicrobia bacterium]
MSKQSTISFIAYALCIVITSSCAQKSSLDVSATHHSSSFEREVLAEINSVRMYPVKYASRLEEIKKQYDERLSKSPEERAKQPDASMQAFYEAIQLLQSTPALPALKISHGMSLAAREQLRDQEQADTISPRGRDGSNIAESLNRYGAWKMGVGEIVASGSETAQRLVIQLIIDHDNPGRQRRLSVLNPDFSVTGIACKDHVR